MRIMQIKEYGLFPVTLSGLTALSDNVKTICLTIISHLLEFQVLNTNNSREIIKWLILEFTVVPSQVTGPSTNK